MRNKNLQDCLVRCIYTTANMFLRIAPPPPPGFFQKCLKKYAQVNDMAHTHTNVVSRYPPKKTAFREQQYVAPSLSQDDLT